MRLLLFASMLLLAVPARADGAALPAPAGAPTHVAAPAAAACPR